MHHDDILARLRAHRLPGLEGLVPEGEWVLPNYQGLSIANIPATVAALLDIEFGRSQDPWRPTAPALPTEVWAGWVPGLQRIVLVILDALGYLQLQHHLAADPDLRFHQLIDAGQLIPLTTVFPSTTNAALMTLRTGSPPASHGMLAYELYLREFGIAADMILLCPVWARERDSLVRWGLEPETFVPVTPLAKQLTAHGVRTGVVTHQSYLGSGFSTMLFRGVEDVQGHLFASDLWTNTRQLLVRHRGHRSFITAYWGALDTIAHLVGHRTPAWEAELRGLSYLLGREFLDALPAQDRDGTLLLITADHGIIHIPEERVVTVHEEPGLRQHLSAPVMGESRAAILHTLPGHAIALRASLAEAYPDCFVVLDSAQALEAGLMGEPVLEETRARAGDLLVLPREDYALQRAVPDPQLVGRHGGLSAEEMLVPLLGARLDALP